MSSQHFVIEWPLWGLRLRKDKRIGVNLTQFRQPSWAQWDMTEQSDVVNEYAGYPLGLERRGLPSSAKPPVCMRGFSGVDPEGQPYPPIELHEDWARTMVASLRLYDVGEFVDPAETGTYLTYPKTSKTTRFVKREVRPFRSAFYGSEPRHPYVLRRRDAQPLTVLALWVEEIRHDPVHLNAALALESFGLSFATASSGAECALHRFIALEALLGTVRGAQAGASFAVRASNATGGDPAALDWLDGAATLRNRLAHEFASVSPTAEDLEQLHEVTRRVLYSYVVWVAELGEPPSDHPVRDFNRALAAGPVGEA